MKTNLKNKKWCWVATEIKGGWRLKLEAGSETYNLSGLVLTTMEAVKEITGGHRIVFAHLKNSKFGPF